MIENFKGMLKRDRGQALIEFAFVAPLFLVLLLTILDFGIALDRREVIQHAVREGARQGAVGASESEITTITVNQSQGRFAAGDVTVCYVDGDGGSPPAGTVGSNVRVSGTYDYELFFGTDGLFEWLGVDPSAFTVNMTPSAEARLEQSLAGVTECP
jgi:Flp pilus assembly protein TadG